MSVTYWGNPSNPIIDSGNVATGFTAAIITPVVGIPLAIMASAVDVPIGSGNETNPPVTNQVYLVGNNPTAQYFWIAAPAVWSGSRPLYTYYFMDYLSCMQFCTFFASPVYAANFGFACGQSAFSGTGPQSITINHNLPIQPQVGFIQPIFQNNQNAPLISAADATNGVLVTFPNSDQVTFTSSFGAPGYSFYWFVFYSLPGNTLFTCGTYPASQSEGGITKFKHGLVDNKGNPVRPSFVYVQPNQQSTEPYGIYGASISGTTSEVLLDPTYLTLYTVQNTPYNWIAMANSFTYSSPTYAE